ncbi:hypothetical protein OAP65_04585 [Litorivicinus sp.]|nr:hypothetical protein [Litorivicinus sp.]
MRINGKDFRLHQIADTIQSVLIENHTAGMRGSVGPKADLKHEGPIVTVSIGKELWANGSKIPISLRQLVVASKAYLVFKLTRLTINMRNLPLFFEGLVDREFFWFIAIAQIVKEDFPEVDVHLRFENRPREHVVFNIIRTGRVFFWYSSPAIMWHRANLFAPLVADDLHDSLCSQATQFLPYFHCLKAPENSAELEASKVNIKSLTGRFGNGVVIIISAGNSALSLFEARRLRDHLSSNLLCILNEHPRDKKTFASSDPSISGSYRFIHLCCGSTNAVAKTEWLGNRFSERIIFSNGQTLPFHPIPESRIEYCEITYE